MYQKAVVKLVILLFFTTSTYGIRLPDLNQFVCICKLSNNSANQADILDSLLCRSYEFNKNITKYWLENFSNKINISPMIIAIENHADNSIIISLLKHMKEYNLDINNTYNTDGKFILTLAVQQHNYELVKLLLKYNCRCNWDKNKKTSALHLAAELNYIDFINLLVNYMDDNINIHTYDNKKHTPLSYIIKNKNNKYAIRLLYKYAATFEMIYVGKNSYFSLFHKNDVYVPDLDLFVK